MNPRRGQGQEGEAAWRDGSGTLVRCCRATSSLHTGCWLVGMLGGNGRRRGQGGEAARRDGFGPLVR